MKATKVIGHYTSLFRVEQSFRLYKSDVRVRPAFHYKPERIQAHVVICMLALTVMRILEQKVRPLDLTIEQTVYEISTARAAIVNLNNQEFVVPPAYTPVQAKAPYANNYPTKPVFFGYKKLNTSSMNLWVHLLGL